MTGIHSSSTHCYDAQNGYSQVLTPLAKGAHIVFNTTVARIDYSHHKHVVAHAVDGRSWAGRMVVVTVPLGVLKAGTIAFEPPLPAWKHDAIHRVGFGRYDGHHVID